MKYLVIFFLFISNAKADFPDKAPDYGMGPAWDEFIKEWKSSKEYKEEYDKQLRSTKEPHVQHPINRCLLARNFTACDSSACVMFSKKEYNQEWINLAKTISKKKCEVPGVEYRVSNLISEISESIKDCIKKAPFRDRNLCAKIDEENKKLKLKTEHQF